MSTDEEREIPEFIDHFPVVCRIPSEDMAHNIATISQFTGNIAVYLDPELDEGVAGIWTYWTRCIVSPEVYEYMTTITEDNEEYEVEYEDEEDYDEYLITEPLNIPEGDPEE